MGFAADNKGRSKENGKVSMFSVCFPLGQNRQRIGPSPDSPSLCPSFERRLSQFLHLLCTTLFLCRTLCTCCILWHICLSMLGEGRVTTSIGVSTLGAFLHLPMCVRSPGHLWELTSKAWIWIKPQIEGVTGIQILKSNLGNQHSTTKCW